LDQAEILTTGPKHMIFHFVRFGSLIRGLWLKQCLFRFDVLNVNIVYEYYVNAIGNK